MNNELKKAWNKRIQLLNKSKEYTKKGNALLHKAKLLDKKGYAIYEAGDIQRTDDNVISAEGNLGIWQGLMVGYKSDLIKQQGHNLKLIAKQLIYKAEITFAKAILKQFGNVNIQWKNNCTMCILPNGEIYK